MNVPRPPRGAFSLLELVLAIGLSVAVVALLGTAIELHLHKLDASRATVERAQLARALLNRIAADIRAATVAPTQDVSELLAAAEAAAQFNVDEVDQSAEPTEATDQSAASSNPADAIGLSGSPEEFWVDRRRIGSRLEAPGAPAASTTMAAPTARIEAGWVRVRWAMSPDAASPGLMRVEATRDEQVWRVTQGDAQVTDVPIASEVFALGLRYHDGQQLVDVWDALERQALPSAVEVTLRLRPLAGEDDADASAADLTVRIYRRLVRLPAAEFENDGSSAADSSSDSEGI